MPFSRDLLLINLAALLRSLGIGLMGVLLGIYLFREGFSSVDIGLVIAAGLAGAAVSTSVVSVLGDRQGRKRTLVVLSVLTSVSGLALGITPKLAGLLPLAFVGMLNGMGTDRSAAFALEQAIIPSLGPDARRTWSLAWYNVVLDSGGALGALGAGLPLALQRWLQFDLHASYRAVFFGYAILNLLSGVCYLFLSPRVEVLCPKTVASQSFSLSSDSRKILTKLVALFSMDAFGGGFLTDALIAYWFFRRFGVEEQSLGVLFFVVHLLNATSHLGAAWLARRIGLVNTMVFTHLPSSLFLVAVPFAHSFKLAVVFFLIREALVEMDVPTRQSYVTAVVRLEERTFASGVTNLARIVLWAVASSVAGVFMQNVAFSAPLVIGGGIKVGYDLLLYRAFRGLKPPEEVKLQ